MYHPRVDQEIFRVGIERERERDEEIRGDHQQQCNFCKTTELVGTGCNYCLEGIANSQG